MPKFSDYFSIKLSQHQLDFVDISTDYDTEVYVDPYAIEIRDDIWAAEASEAIRAFFTEVLDSLRRGDDERARNLMSHLREPSETFLGISEYEPKGRGVGTKQAKQLINAIKRSEAFETGLLTDLSEMALYVEGVDRDKISDLTTNVIRRMLVEYTQQQCSLHDVPINDYNGPPLWDHKRRNWISSIVQLPFVDDKAVILVPKYVVRRKLSLDSQEFYNKQLTDFLVAENLRANSSLVQTITTKTKTYQKVFKKDVRERYPKSKNLIADMIRQNPDLLDLYKEIAKQSSFLTTFHEDQTSIHEVCRLMANALKKLSPGAKDADKYHKFAMGALTTIFYPDLIQPHKEWEIHQGRKRVDIVYTNAADSGFFAHRRDGKNTQANTVIVECKNYNSDIANEELDQLLGRFDENRGKFGLMLCRHVDDPKLLDKRCIDMANRSQGFIIVLTDEDLLALLEFKQTLQDNEIQNLMHNKFRAYSLKSARQTQK